MPDLSPDQIREDEQREAAIAERAFVARQRKARDMLARSLPQQHRQSKLANFTFHGTKAEWDRQRHVRDGLVDICRDVRQFVALRGQLFLWGTVGTGKDHLLVACAKAAAMQGITCRFLEGEAFYSDYLVGDDRQAAIGFAVEPHVLVLSDPVSTRQWTEGRQLALRRLVNARWNLGRPTWVSCNVPSLTSSGSRPRQDFHDRMAGKADQSLSAEDLFGADTLSRLMDGGVVYECRWPDYRLRRQQVIANTNRKGNQ
jgi:DNA replication protein DnaC